MANYGLIDLDKLDEEIKFQDNVREVEDDCLINNLTYVRKILTDQAKLIDMMVYCVQEHPEAYYKTMEDVIATLKYIFTKDDNALGLTLLNKESKFYHLKSKKWLDVVFEFSDCFIAVEETTVIIVNKSECLTYDQYMKKFRAKYKSKN